VNEENENRSMIDRMAVRVRLNRKDYICQNGRITLVRDTSRITAALYVECLNPDIFKCRSTFTFDSIEFLLNYGR